MHLEYSLSDAKNKFSEVIASVENGDDIIVTKNGLPVAKISSATGEKASLVGWGKGKIKLSDDFDTWDDEEAHALGIVD